MGIRFYVIIISAYSFLERHVESDSMYIRFYVIIKSTSRPVVDISCPRSIIAEDSTAQEQSRSIIASFGEAGQLLREWKDVTLEMFPQRQDLIDMIPDPSDMSPTKLLGGMVSTDTCNTARLTRQTLCDAIIQEGRDAGLVDNELNMYQGNCHQHLHNILVDAGANHLSSKLTELLCDDLSIIPPHLRVTCNISHILRACDKEFGFTANYAKGHVPFLAVDIPSGISIRPGRKGIEWQPTGCII